MDISSEEVPLAGPWRNRTTKIFWNRRRATDVIMKKLDGELVLGWKERTRHISWTWFTMTMATGGLANAIYSGTVNEKNFSLISVFLD